MLEALFANPAALTVGGAMVSSPILIHLINRMRFKRLRWAAMEFLLKSQKRNRRRLIIEQLLLLFLRCLLILLAAVLMSRFIGCTNTFGGHYERESNVHVILLDDTLSMHDRVKGKETCFTAAKREILDNIAGNVKQSSTDDSIIILRPSDTIVGFEPKPYEKLSDPTKYAALDTDLSKMECTVLSLPLTETLQRIKKIADDAPNEVKVTVHVLSDFRKVDWAGTEAKELHKLMATLGKHARVKMVYLTDLASPERVPAQGGTPAYNDNLGIVEIRPNTRVISNGSRVTFTVTVQNFGPRDVEVRLQPYDNISGKEIAEKDFETDGGPGKPLKVPAGGKTAQAVFSMPVRANIGEDGKGFARIGVRLQNAAGAPLENDGLSVDDVRYAVIEVRRTVPVLVIDGRGDDGKRYPGDSYFLATALRLIPGSTYEVVFGQDLSGGDPRAALESSELANFTSILMVNVPKLQNPQQTANLERFVKEGGGVCFFMGPDVDPKFYNEDLYRKGFGVFPVPLADAFLPLPGEKVPPPEYTGRYQLLLRDDQFPKTEKIPVFGPVFYKKEMREFLKHLPVQRYWPARPVEEWGSEVGKVKEVANLPNEQIATKFGNDVKQLVNEFPIDKKEAAQWNMGLKRHAGYLVGASSGSANVPAYKLAELIDYMLVDKGKENDRFDYPNMVEFWDQKDMQDLKQKVLNLRRRLLYSNPLVLTKDFGHGRVVAWMTTAGTEWNPWAAGGVSANIIYAPLIYELQNYLTSQSGDSGQLVGSPLALMVDAKRFLQNKTLKITRKFYKPVMDGPEVAAAPTVHPGEKEGNQVTFKITNSLQPGFYEERLNYTDDDEAAAPRASWGHVFNVDTRAEGNLQRASQDELDSGFMREAKNSKGEPTIVWRMGRGTAEGLINKAWDLSEWPPYFLFFIIVLVGEQALAVHMSGHLRTTEAELPTQVTTPHAAKAA
jgi:hypothetical protein